MRSKAKIVLSAALYIIPVIFLIITYMFMTATAEDVLQGAGGHGDPLYGLIMAFGYNSRLSDMYAYTVINFFDYQFSFGVDTIFRLLDVAMGVGIMFAMTSMIIGRKPRFCLTDGAVFAFTLPAIYLGHFCDSLYLGFSHLHNYLVICLFSMLFFLPFAMYVLGKGPKDGIVTWTAMFILGFLFGFSSNVTPVAFLATLLFLLIWLFVSGHKPQKIFRSWIFAAVLGILAACVLMYVFGAGISHYADADGDYSVMTDYITFGEALTAPIWVLRHIVLNFGAMRPYLIPMLITFTFEIMAYKLGLFGEENPRMIHFSAVCLLFVTMHILVETQIVITSLVRLTMPAYLVAVISVSASFIRMLSLVVRPKAVTVISAALVLLCTLMTADMAKFRIEYNSKAARVLDEIKNSKGDTAYVAYDETFMPGISIFGFTQYPIVQEWANDTPIYGKKIVILDKNGKVKKEKKESE